MNWNRIWPVAVGALVLLVLLLFGVGLLTGPVWGGGWTGPVWGGGWGCPGCPMMGRWGWGVGNVWWAMGMMLLGVVIPLLFFALLAIAMIWLAQQVIRLGGPGAPAPTAARCPQCGRPVQTDWAHCPYCGTALTGRSA